MPLADSNPFVNPPRLPSSTRPGLHTRNPSRSPVRQHPRDYDPMLRNLSPTSTLRAFITLPHEANNSDALAASVRTSSASERALGAKAAQACLDLRTWTLEIEGWQWPGTFDFPEPARKKLGMAVSSSGNPAANYDEEEYWGSLPARIVKDYERRADEIGQCLDDMDVEELKEFVLNSHYRVDSRPASRNKRLSLSSTSSDTSMKRLDDYTALVTATILQALPFLTRLSRLLDVWTIRLIVLRNAPRYYQDLQRARLSLDDCWNAITANSIPEVPSGITKFDRKIMSDMKRKIEQQVGSLGRKLDRFLDDLEGRDDTVPDSWIDEFELLETAYGSWVVQAERKVLENEWNHRKSVVEQRPMTATHQETKIGPMLDEGLVSEVEDPALDEAAVMRPSIDRIRSRASLNRISTAGPQLVLSIPNDSEADQADRDRSASDSARSGKDEEARQVAKRRAAFLHDIEINNSLKSSKSPVRPFEHASSAFTKLFKKHQSPEQVRNKRSVSNNVNGSTNVDGISPLERKPLTPSSATSSKWNSLSRQGSTRSDGDPFKASQGVPEVDLAKEQNGKPGMENQRVASEPIQASTSGHTYGPFQIDVSEKPPPETYRPTGLDSPFSSPEKETFSDEVKEDFPENWPLQQASAHRAEDDLVDDRQRGQNIEEAASAPDEIYKPSTTIETDAFDQLFVQNMPAVPSERLDSTQSPNLVTLQRPLSRARSGDATYLDMVPGRSRPPSSSRPASSSRSAEYASVRSVPELSPTPLTERFENDDSRLAPSDQVYSGTAQNLPRPSAHTSTSSPPASPVSINVSEDMMFDDEIQTARPYPIKRASTTSIEIFSRSEVKSVDVQRQSRHGSVSSRPTPPHTPGLPAEQDPFSKTRPMNYKGMVAFPSPPLRRTSLPGQAITPGPSTLPDLTESSPSAAETSGSPMTDAASAPLNVAMTKRRVKKSMQKENERPDSRNGGRASPAPYVDARDTFDRHVSEVLQTLPAQIRFKPRAGAETPVPRGYMAPRTKMPNMRVPSRTSNMTIAPAESSPKKSSSASDPEVKLYHLTQAGREEPIKLFVRLVGEGERVMVRVGGGWADLADYLRQYADHHGSRTVSDGALEVQALTAPLGSRKASGPLETRARTPGPGTPNPGTPLRPSSNGSEKDFYGRASTPNGERPLTNGRQTPTSTHTSTPKSTSTGSRPSTANMSRPPSRQGDVGLSGGKKVLLPEHKAKWVEGMIERAKKASAEKSKEDNSKYFGELGKAGGTRRVIFRSSPGPGEKK